MDGADVCQLARKNRNRRHGVQQTDSRVTALIWLDQAPVLLGVSWVADASVFSGNSMPGKIEPGVGSSIRHKPKSTDSQKGYIVPHAPRLTGTKVHNRRNHSRLRTLKRDRSPVYVEGELK